MVSVCVTLSTDSMENITMDIPFTLTSSNDTGNAHVEKTIISLLCSSSHAASAGMDYDPITINGTFSNGSMAGSMECENVTIIDDGALELDETFTVTLNTSEPEVTLDTNATTITITDDDS